MAVIYPDFATIAHMRVQPTDGEFHLLNILNAQLSSEYEVFFQPFLDGDHPDIIILKKSCGVIIVEVKDWALPLYNINTNNQWTVKTNNKIQIIKSPMAQVFHYKKNIFDLHVPIAGIANITNKNFYKTITCSVYFHGNKKPDLDFLYGFSLNEINKQINELNLLSKTKSINITDYDYQYNILINKKRKLDRDKNLSFTKDMVDKKLNKWNSLQENKLFTDDIYEEFKRRLSPSEFIFTQDKLTSLNKNIFNSITKEAEKPTLNLDLNNDQKNLVSSHDERIKIEGVSGSGKTTLLALRALNALKRTNSGNILIILFNLTLKNYVRDIVSKMNFIYFNGEYNKYKIEITSYHRFFLDAANDANIEIEDEKVSNFTIFDDKDIFKGRQLKKYDSIFVDEIQDFKLEWIDIIRNYFLQDKGEMVIFGDKSQDIYTRRNMNDDLENKDQLLAKKSILGFGHWKKLPPLSYRIQTDFLFDIAKDFCEYFLNDDYKGAQKPSQTKLNLGIYSYKTYCKNKINNIAIEMDNLIKKQRINPNDIAFIASDRLSLRIIEEYFNNYEKTMTAFATNKEIKQIINKHDKIFNNIIKYKKVEYPIKFWNLCENYFLSQYDIFTKQIFRDNVIKLCKVMKIDDKLKYIFDLISNIEKDIRELDRTKKNYFQMNSGLLKFSTIHSFKGMQSPSIVVILNDGNIPEMVYCAITRAKNNLFIYDIPDSPYKIFFTKYINR